MEFNSDEEKLVAEILKDEQAIVLDDETDIMSIEDFIRF